MFSFDLMFQPLRKYFDFQGRARRSEYWLWVGFQFVLGIVYNVLQSAGGAVAGLVTFVFHVLDGTPGQNRFGADPKGRGEAEQISATFGSFF